MIEFRNISVRVDSFELGNVSFVVDPGRYAVLTGPTGAGKTTLLELMCGLRRPDGGRILIAGRDATALSPGERGVGYVPQDGVLFSTSTVREHLAFGLRLRGVSRSDIGRRVTALAERLGISGILDRKPRGLSGGEKQRVALGRAISWAPSVLALDEPLSALDGETRAQMHDLLREIHRENTATVLHVTHDERDARELADLVLVLRAGRVSEPRLNNEKSGAGSPPGSPARSPRHGP